MPTLPGEKLLGYTPTDWLQPVVTLLSSPPLTVCYRPELTRMARFNRNSWYQLSRGPTDQCVSSQTVFVHGARVWHCSLGHSLMAPSSARVSAIESKNN